MTVFRLHTRDELLAVRFACSPLWETNAAVRTLVNRRARAYHRPWQRLIQDKLPRLELEPLLAVQPLRGFVPDFLTPPPATPRPRLRDELAEVASTPPDRVARELERCLADVTDLGRRHTIEGLLEDPGAARELLARRLYAAWLVLVAPFWPRIRLLLERDIEYRSRTFSRHGLRRTVNELDPRVKLTERGLSVRDRNAARVELDERGLVLMPSAYHWPGIAAVVDESWLPTLVYPARGIGELWRTPQPPPRALERLLGPTRARVLTSLEQPLSTTALAASLELSPAGASRHLLALRDAGLLSTERYGHEVRYRRTTLAAALVARAEEPAR